jgi:hypothetical protein
MADTARADENRAIVATLRDLADQIERGELGFPSLDQRVDTDLSLVEGDLWARERPTPWETFTLRAARWARVRTAPAEVA